MGVNFAVRAVVIFIILSLFSCGDLETLLPSNGSYQVRTLVNGVSLEDCSLIRSNDKIRPYFATSVVNDPDLIGLLVYLQNAQGEVAGDKVRYILQTYADESKQTNPAEAETGLEDDNEIFDDDDEPGEITGENSALLEDGDEEETENLLPWDLPDQWTAREKWGFNNTSPIEEIVAVEIVVKSLADELPYFPLPKNLEIGPYTLVFEAIGKREILSRTETNIFYLGNVEFTLKDISMYLPGLSGTQLISPGTMALLEARLGFDSRLDPYVIWYNGRNVIKRGKISDGAGSLLWKAPEQAGFYSLRMEVFPFQLKQNFAGISREIALPVSPKAVSLGYFFENDLKYTARSALSAGTAYHEQLELVAAEIAAMAVAMAENPENEEEAPPVPPPPPELLRWYQFEGNLFDSTSPLTDENTLVQVSAKAPLWAAAVQSYGLSTGPDDAYRIPPLDFFQKEEDQGGGIFLLHISPSTEGTIFNAFFPLQNSESNGAWIELERKNNAFALRLNAGGTAVEIPVYSSLLESRRLIPIVVEFYIRPYRLEAKITLEDAFGSNVGSIKLPDALSGEGRIRLGGKNSPTAQTLTVLTPNLPEPLPQKPEEKTDEDAVETFATSTPAQPKAAPPVPPVPPVHQASTVWDELAILFSAVPLLPEEPLVEEIVEQDAVAEVNAPAVQQEAESQKIATPAESSLAETDETESETVETETDIAPPAAHPAASADDSMHEAEIPPTDIIL
ncbi:MAG: hypothetical protein LBI06_09290 [Treponema sp.]|jgi:hypothetical protein|nr:hypothetical protein [Treponema sp.]